MTNTGYNVIDEFNEGSAAAFEVVFNLYYSELCNFSYKLLGCKEDAKDIVSDVFSNLLKQQRLNAGENNRDRHFSEVENIKRFLYVAVRNACFNFLKFQNRIYKKQKELSYLFTETELEATQIEEGVWTAINTTIESLPPDCKRVFNMIFFEGRKLSEIASELDISINTVKSHRGKAIRLLRGLFSDNETLVVLLLSFWKTLDNTLTK